MELCINIKSTRHYKASNLYLCLVKVAGVVLHILINNPCAASTRHLSSQLQSLQIRLGAFLFSPQPVSYEFSTPGAGAGLTFNKKTAGAFRISSPKILLFGQPSRMLYPCVCGNMLERGERCPNKNCNGL